MPKQYRSVIKAVQGEDIPISVPVYEFGVLVDDIASATFSYFGGSMTSAVTETAIVDGDSVISYTLPNTDTSALDEGLYVYAFKIVTDGGLAEVVLNGFIIIKEDVFVEPPEVPAP